MKRRMEKMCVWVSIIALVVLMGACGKTTSGDEQGKAFVIAGYDIEITCPSDWKQVDTTNFDLVCTDRKDTVNMNVFAYTLEELGEGGSAESIFTSQALFIK
ncbi:MAG: hypothetical protein GX115_03800 [Ruminiclostridium sp.]|nr:hypothetical protein [Ruminiclostridium sp.]